MTYLSQPGVGFGNIAAGFKNSFNSNIKLGAKVAEINCEDPDLAIVLYTQNGVYRDVATRTVLITVSLGVLKANTINFVPSIPDYKHDVINPTVGSSLVTHTEGPPSRSLLPGFVTLRDVDFR